MGRRTGLRSRRTESNGSLDVQSRIRIRTASYAYRSNERGHPDSPFVEGAAPHHSAQLRSHFDLRKNMALDAEAYAVGRLTNQGPSSNVTIPAYPRLDVRLTWKPWEQTSFSLVGQNLLQDHHLEFEDVNGALQASQIRRSGYAKFSWAF